MARFIPVECESKDMDVIVLYSIFPTEFDVQHSLCSRLEHLCRMADDGTEVKSEVTVSCDKIKARFDLMIFRAQKPVCAIEVKRSGNHKTEHSETQLKKYNMFKRVTGIPVIYCEGMDEVDFVVKQVGNII